MQDNETPATSGTGDTFDFVPPNRDIIREDNWPDFDARGFCPIRRGSVHEVQEQFGVDNLYTGDAWDEEAGRPLRYKPGKGLYVAPEGFDFMAEAFARGKQARKHQEPSSDDPAAS